MSSLPYFAFGTELIDVDTDVDARRAVLADHMWMWADHGRAVAVPVAGRSVHGVLVDGGAVPAAGVAVRVGVVTEAGAPVAALAIVESDPDPGPPPPAVLDTVIAAARRVGLPADWLEYLQAWRRAGRRVPDAGSTSGAPGSLAELLMVPGVVEESELRSSFGFMAIHGGSLEAMTDVVARRAAAAAGASYYGVLYPDSVDVHLSSTAYLPSESSTLARFLGHVDVVVSVHGFGRAGQWRSILLGGRNRALAAHICRQLTEALHEYDAVADIDAIPAELRGMHERNPVNAPATHGVQIELPPRVRGLSPLSPPKGPDGLSPPTRALVDALVSAATTWT